MKTKKKVLAIALVAAMIAIISLGSLAWFTDNDEVTNVFTLGEVNIGLHDEDGDGENFNDNPHPILPGVPVDKVVYVTNDANTGLTGNDAYVRTYIGIPEKLDSVLEKTWDTTGDWTLDNADYIAEIDGVRYKVYQFTYTGAVDGKLAAGDKTAPVLSKIELKKEVDIKDGKLCIPGVETFNFDINALRQLMVPVAMQAIQTAGFTDANAAFAAGFNGCPWDKAGEENPAAASLNIAAEDLDVPHTLIWNAPEASGFENITFEIPANSFEVPVEISVEVGEPVGEGGPCELSIAFYQLDNEGNRVMEGEGDDAYPVSVLPTVGDDFLIKVASTHEFVGSDEIASIISFEPDLNNQLGSWNTMAKLLNIIAQNWNK